MAPAVMQSSLENLLGMPAAHSGYQQQMVQVHLHQIQEQQMLQQHLLQQQQALLYSHQQQQQGHFGAVPHSAEPPQAWHGGGSTSATRQPAPARATVNNARAEAEAKGAISMLQEYVQCSKGFHVPPKCPVLQWSYGTRTVEGSRLEFRATVTLLLDGLPHHAAGSWRPSKKVAQRDAAERALVFLVGVCGEQLLKSNRPTDSDRETDVEDDESAGRNDGATAGDTGSAGSFEAGDVGDADAGGSCGHSDGAGHVSEKPEVALLRRFCLRSKSFEHTAPQWNCSQDDDGRWQAVTELIIYGVRHKFAGPFCAGEAEAKQEAARRVLWYLEHPSFGNAFEPDPEVLATMTRHLPTPPAHWAGDADEFSAVQDAERKTTVMRVQNRLQQALAPLVKSGERVWEWTFETMPEEEGRSPPTVRATVRIPELGQEFVGRWAEGQRNAQLELCDVVTRFLDQGGVGEVDA